MGETVKLTARKLSYVVQIAITGTDDQGRETGICPDCSSEGYFDAGRFCCPTWSAVGAVLAESYEILRRDTEPTFVGAAFGGPGA